MPSRRISANESLAVVQEIAVNPYSAYNSDNVNMLTRAITGEKNKDFIVNGLDVYGVNRVNSEVIESILINETFPNETAFNTNWTNTYFSYNSGVAFTGLSGTNVSQQSILKSVLAPLEDNIGYWFKITFDLSDKTQMLYVQYGSEIKVFDHPESGTYSFYLQLYNNGGVFESLTFSVNLNSLDVYSQNYTSIDNVKLEKVSNKANPINPIALPSAELPDTYTGAFLDHTHIPEYMLHPHESLKVYPGICIKDEAVLNLLGTNPSYKEVITLTYNDDDSWVKGEAYQSSDFTGTSYYTQDGGTAMPISFTDGVLNEALFDDGQSDGPTYYKKIVGNSVGTNPAVVKWAYVCIYYSFFKNPDPNKAYIGLVKEEDVKNIMYGEDFLILAKLRFVDKNTVDAIIYYPDRKDWGFIDALRVTYIHVNQLKYWTDKPANVSLALDLLAKKIYNFRGVLFFATHQQFYLWRNSIGGDRTGTGTGPAMSSPESKNFLQWLHGMDAENGYDLLAYVVETQTLWRSQVRLTGSVYEIDIVNGGSGYNDETTRVYAKSADGVIEELNRTVGSGTSSSSSIEPIISGPITYISIPLSSYTTTPDIIIKDESGTGAIARAIMNPVMDGYKVVVDWYEACQKRFEVNWGNDSNIALIDGWPTNKPENWLWYEETTNTESDPTFKTLSEVQNLWPNAYYRVAGSAELPQHTIVNPFNSRGSGTTPGPTTSEISNDAFLRADGTWRDPARIPSFSFFIQGYLVANSDVGEVLIERDITLNTMTVSLDSLPIAAITGVSIESEGLENTSSSSSSLSTDYLPGTHTLEIVGAILNYTVINNIIDSVTINTIGWDCTPGTYNISVPGGNGGLIEYNVGVNRRVDSASVLFGGNSYSNGTHSLPIYSGKLDYIISNSGELISVTINTARTNSVETGTFNIGIHGGVIGYRVDSGGHLIIGSAEVLVPGRGYNEGTYEIIVPGGTGVIQYTVLPARDEIATAQIINVGGGYIPSNDGSGMYYQVQIVGGNNDGIIIYNIKSDGTLYDWSFGSGGTNYVPGTYYATTPGRSSGIIYYKVVNGSIVDSNVTSLGTNGGSGYIDNDYYSLNIIDVPGGVGGQIHFALNSGIITSTNIVNAGNSYHDGDYLYYVIGGNGAIFKYIVQNDGTINTNSQALLPTNGCWVGKGYPLSSQSVQVDSAIINYTIESQVIIKLYQKQFTNDIFGGSWYVNPPLASIIILPSSTGSKWKEVMFKDVKFLKDQILLAKCTSTGPTPYEGGSDTKITLYHKIV